MSQDSLKNYGLLKDIKKVTIFSTNDCSVYRVTEDYMVPSGGVCTCGGSVTDTDYEIGAGWYIVDTLAECDIVADIEELEGYGEDILKAAKIEMER